MGAQTQHRVISALCAIMLLFTYIGAGLAICAAIPQVTSILSSANSEFDASPYTKDDLTSLAVETRNFTIDDFERSSLGNEGAADKLADIICEKARTSLSDAAKQDLWNEEARGVLDDWDSYPTGTEAMNSLYGAGKGYSLDNDAISHLNNVNDLFSKLQLPLIGISILAVFCIMAIIRVYGVQGASLPLLASGAAAILLLLIFGLWALIDFNGFFACLHGLFFADGSWTFPADSLLIEMYPQGFWVGMGTVWLGSTIAISLLSIIFGSIIRSRTKHEENKDVATSI